MDNEKESRFFTGWLWAALALIALSIALIWFLYYTPPPSGTFLFKLTDGFIGSIVSGAIQGLIFLFLALHMGQKTEDRVKLSTDILTRQADRIETERKLLRFEEFMKTGDHYNVRFPDLKLGKQTLGLEYKIMPRRDESGSPLQRRSQMNSQFVVTVIEPAHKNVLDEETLLDYEDSPIKENEPYFCSFYNGDWHMSQESYGIGEHRFYFSGKIGDVEHGMVAAINSCSTDFV